MTDAIWHYHDHDHDPGHHPEYGYDHDDHVEDNDWAGGGGSWRHREDALWPRDWLPPSHHLGHALLSLWSEGKMIKVIETISSSSSSNITASGSVFDTTLINFIIMMFVIVIIIVIVIVLSTDAKTECKACEYCWVNGQSTSARPGLDFLFIREV